MANEQNLKPFKEGYDERRNLDGRPDGARNRSTTVRKWLNVPTKVKNVVTGTEEDGTVEDLVILSAIKKATQDSDIQAIKEILDSAYGKATQPMEHSGANGKPLLFLSADRLSDEQIDKYLNETGTDDKGI